jgi:hypothetical protein
LELEELTVLTAWAEGVSEAAQHAPERVDQLLATARNGANWRAQLDLKDLSPRLEAAIESLERVTQHANLAGESPFESLVTTARENHPNETELVQLVRRVLISTLEERGTRQRVNDAP